MKFNCTFKAGCVCTVFSLLLVSPVLSQCYYVSDTDNNLYDYNRTTMNNMLIGANDSTNIETVAADHSNGTIYAAHGGQVGTLNTSDGSFTPLAQSTPYGDIDGLAIHNGTMYGSVRQSGNDLLIQINPTSGALIGTGKSISGTLGDIDEITFDAGGTLYGIANTGNTGGNDLVTINTATGAATTIVDDIQVCKKTDCSNGTRDLTDIESLTFDENGVLWVITGDGANASNHNKLFTLNVSTGIATYVATLSGGDVEGFDCYTQMPVLPVRLMDFNVESKSLDEINIVWSTATEINSDYFEIERKLGHHHPFSSIGVVSASGNSSTIRNYKYVDYLSDHVRAQGEIYYRLKQVDLDGQYEYTDIKSIRINEYGKQIQLFPNPASLFLNFIPDTNFKSLQLRILGSNGQVFQSFARMENQQQIQLNINVLPKGVYFLEVIFPHDIQKYRFIKG